MRSIWADLVESTETVARLGAEAGEAWRQRFLAAMREALAATRGREVQLGSAQRMRLPCYESGLALEESFDAPTLAARGFGMVLHAEQAQELVGRITAR